MRADVRGSAKWKRVRAVVLRQATHCAVCGLALVPDARPRSRWSSSVDHIVPLERGGAPFDLGNLRAVHLGCNARLGAVIGNRSAKRRRAVRKLERKSVLARAERANWW